MKIENASQLPRVFYGLHMVEGVAEYQADTGTSRIFIGETALKEMNPSFAGKPLYVGHQDVDMANLQAQADGYVVESFFNKSDGKYWAKFLAVSDKAHEAIRKGWKLSNAYLVKASKGAGQWHAVSYDQEVAEGEYQHLAVVPNPRYEESVILTPEEFRLYNDRKDSELRVLENSLPREKKMLFNLFSKKKIENTAELESAIVQLADGSERSLADIIKFVENASAEADKKTKEEAAEAEKAAALKANSELDLNAMVNVGDDKMSVKDLVAKYQSLNSKANASAVEEKTCKCPEGKCECEKKNQTAADPETEKKDDEKKDDEKTNAAHFEALKNANLAALSQERSVDTAMDQAARGTSRYGSK